MRNLLIALALVTSPFILMAQDGRGTITGRVVDTSGAVVPGAEVHAVNVQSGASAGAVTSASGTYSIPYLLPGTYTVSAEQKGFKKTERRDIEVRVDDVLNLELQLQVGSTTESVEVAAVPPLLEVSNVSLGQVVDARRMAELPIQAGNPDELVLLTPGVVNTTNLKARKASFNNAASQFSTDGGIQFSNDYTIDGVPNSFSVGSNPNNAVIAFQPPQSAVSEFKVETSAFDASVGHTPGALLNLVTKSGTSQYHGELHEWLANSALDAPTFFVNRSGQKKQVYQDNRYGASIGGPFRIPKLYDGKKSFFFYAWESNNWGKPTSVVGSVPTAAEINGDLTKLFTGTTGQIYNPYSTHPQGAFLMRDAFRCDVAGNPLPLISGQRYQFTPGGPAPAGSVQCNKIPAALLDPVAQKIMASYAAPNTPTKNADGTSNYTRATNDTFKYYVHFFRFDHEFSEKNRMFLRFDYDHQLENQSNFYGNLATGLLLTRINRGLALDEVLVLNASNVLNLRYGLTDGETPEQRRSKPFDLSTLGFSPNLVGQFDKSTATFPNVFIGTSQLTKPCSGPCNGTLSGFGNFRDGDGTTTGYIHDFSATLNNYRGKHNLRYGVDFRLYRSFVRRGGYDVSPGLQFLPTYTKQSSNPNVAGVKGQDVAAFLLGIPSGQAQRSASFATQDWFAGPFIQDDWKVTSKLTLNLGLRYEYESPETERFNRAIRGFDRVTPNPIQAYAAPRYATNPILQLPATQFQALGGLMFANSNNRGLWNGQTTNFLPRIGVAYQMNDKTVVRAGYGIFYDTIGINRSIAIQTGFTTTTPINASLDNGLTYVATTANPFPNVVQPPVAVGTIPGLTANLGQPLTVYPINRKQPYAQRWTLSLQRMLPGQFLIDVAYVGNRGTRLPIDRELNAIPRQYLSRSVEKDSTVITTLGTQVANPFFGYPGTSYFSQTTVGDLLRPFPEFGLISAKDGSTSIIEKESNGYSKYHALQVRGEKRFSHGYTLNVAYTWAKAMDGVRYLNPTDIRPEYDISEFDRPHRIVASAVYDLPFGKGRTYGSSLPKALGYVVGEWTMSSTFAMQSGPPLGPWNDVILRGNIRDVALSGRNVDHWFNTSLFETNSTKQPNADYQIRTFPHFLPQVRGDGQQKWDLSLIKNFPFTERIGMQFRAESYNVLNHPNFDTPNIDPTSGGFGKVTSQGGLSREFQFALKLTF